jgi:CHASE2 domain-containing sensor protein
MRGPISQEEDKVLGLIALLLIVWLVLAVLGFVVKGLVWLAVVGIILFLATAVIGFVRRNTGSRSRL